MSQQTISPRQFDRLQRELIQMELDGYGPEACVIGACKAAGVTAPKPFEPIEIVVALSMQTGD